jgi:Transposase IS200 like
LGIDNRGLKATAKVMPTLRVEELHEFLDTPKIPPNPRLKKSDTNQLKHQPLILGPRERKIVEQAVREVCDYRDYILRAINVRTNHVHAVLTAAREPEPILDAFKSYSTRALRKEKL